jgi:hypothetical protein
MLLKNYTKKIKQGPKKTVKRNKILRIKERLVKKLSTWHFDG